jgi:hypothetical protein
VKSTRTRAAETKTDRTPKAAANGKPAHPHPRNPRDAYRLTSWKIRLLANAVTAIARDLDALDRMVSVTVIRGHAGNVTIHLSGPDPRRTRVYRLRPGAGLGTKRLPGSATSGRDR